MDADTVADARLTADFVLTGISRLVKVAPERAGSGALGVIPKGALAAQNGRIVWVGAEADLAQAVAIEAVPAEARHDVDGRAVLPGFVDSHTHFVFAGERLHSDSRSYSLRTGACITCTMTSPRSSRIHSACVVPSIPLISMPCSFARFATSSAIDFTCRVDVPVTTSM